MNVRIKRIAAAVVRPVMSAMHRCGILRPEVMVHVDGGVSSQIHFFLVGEWFARRQGARVSYDLRWFDEDGMDCLHKFPRNFDLLKLSPSLDFKIVKSRFKSSFYRALYRRVNDYSAPCGEWQSLQAPIYLDGYYGIAPGFYSRMREQVPLDPQGVDEMNGAAAREIESGENAVGMHVRRGDLAQFVASYGEPVKREYYARAVRLMQERFGKDVPVFIFSDEPAWVRSELLGLLPEGNYRLLDMNGSDKGYLDLWLISKCRHFITSTGSFGKFGALLSPGLDASTVIAISDSPESRQWRAHLVPAEVVFL